MKRILITGVTGFVGSTIVASFHTNEGIKLYGHSRDRELAKDRYRNQRIEIITSYSAATINELQIDCIIHLAGIAHDLSSKFISADYYKVNFENSARWYDEFLLSKAAQFIYFSSIKAAIDQ